MGQTEEYAYDTSIEHCARDDLVARRLFVEEVTTFPSVMELKPQKKTKHYDQNGQKDNDDEHIKKFVREIHGEERAELSKGEKGGLLNVSVEHHNEDDPPKTEFPKEKGNWPIEEEPKEHIEGDD